MFAERTFFVVIVISCSCALLFYYTGLQKEFTQSIMQNKQQQLILDKLQGELNYYKELSDKFVKKEQEIKKQLEEVERSSTTTNQTLTDALRQNHLLTLQLQKLQQQIIQFSVLRKQLLVLVKHNRFLRKQIVQLKEKFLLIEPIKDKLAHVETALESLQISRGKEELLRLQLETVSKELSSVNNYLLQILENTPLSVASLQEVTVEQTKRFDPKPLEEKIRKLEDELQQSENQRQLLAKQYEEAKEALANSREELEDRSKKIFSLQEKIMHLENELFDARSESKDKDRQIAILREKYIAVELEKNNIQMALDKINQQMLDLQDKYLTLLGRIGEVLQTPDNQLNQQGHLPTKKGEPKVEVELIPDSKKKR
ncbi:MAG: hypothetical protein N2606_00900 [Candidatus Omnitrophica bacterium]|nr:hypothetical protein [Candidatus Omnitrophota bacterium]